MIIQRVKFIIPHELQAGHVVLTPDDQGQYRFGQARDLDEEVIGELGKGLAGYPAAGPARITNEAVG